MIPVMVDCGDGQGKPDPTGRPPMGLFHPRIEIARLFGRQTPGELRPLAGDKQLGDPGQGQPCRPDMATGRLLAQGVQHGRSHQVTGRMVQRLNRQRLRPVRARHPHAVFGNAAAHLDETVKAAPIDAGSGPAIGIERNIDQSRVEPAQLFRIITQTGEGIGTISVQQDIGACQKVFEGGTTVPGCQIQHRAAFAKRDLRHDARLLPIGRIDAQHLGAIACEKPAGDRTGKDPRQIENPDAVQRTRRIFPFGLLLNLGMIMPMDERFAVDGSALGMRCPGIEAAHRGGAPPGLDNRALQHIGVPLHDFPCEFVAIGTATQNRQRRRAVMGRIGVKADPAVLCPIVACKGIPGRRDPPAIRPQGHSEPQRCQAAVDGYRSRMVGIGPTGQHPTGHTDRRHSKACHIEPGPQFLCALHPDVRQRRCRFRAGKRREDFIIVRDHHALPLVQVNMREIHRSVDNPSILIKIINMNFSDDAAHCTLGSSDVCRILGISRDTLYAYVSRGLVRTAADPGDARRSLYDRRDIDTLMARQSRGRSRRSVAESTIHWGEPVLKSDITRIADGTFFYRSQNAVELSQTGTLEDIAVLLARVHCSASDKTVGTAKSSLQRPFDRIVAMMADHVTARRRSDGRPRAGRIIRSTALCAAGINGDRGSPIHHLLANAWSTDTRAPDLIRRALVLCADHELNASAYAARVAASAGASLPASLLAGLATLSGNLHGGITTRCRSWMDDVDGIIASGASVPVNAKPPPGFGHPLYPEGDPRTKALLQACGLSDGWRHVIGQIHQATGQHPTLDFALAHLERQLTLPDGAGLGIFAVGRTVGWIAHIFEQRETGRLIRPRAAADD